MTIDAESWIAGYRRCLRDLDAEIGRQLRASGLVDADGLKAKLTLALGDDVVRGERRAAKSRVWDGEAAERGWT